MDLRVENGSLESVTIVNHKLKGRIYSIFDSSKDRIGSIFIRFYQEEKESLASIFEEETKNNENKIVIIRDENTVFALKNTEGTIIFANGFMDDKNLVAYENTQYLMETYGKDELGFLEYLNEQLDNKKLELKK